MVIKIHRFLGILLVFFVLVLSITGSLLQHSEIFNIRQNYASSTFAKNIYNIKPCQISSFKKETIWLSICNNDLYFNDRKIASNVSSVSSIVKENSNYNVMYGNHILLINEDSEILGKEHVENLSDGKKNIIFKKNILDSKLKKIIEDKSISKTITYERIIVDIHTGRIFGLFGVTLVDLVTLGIIILSLTGTYSWLRYKKLF